MNKWEIGSEFDWSERFLTSTSHSNWLPDRYELFSTGTACLRAIGRAYPSSTDPPLRIHVPSFYCMAVTRVLQEYFRVLWYKDVPGDLAPDFDSIHVTSGDLVLVANGFGVRGQQLWSDWISEQRKVIVIEDHSHDPFSDWARSSAADYVFSSLRKTLPIPDGGMLCSPKGHPLPTAWGNASPGATKRLSAMLMKRAYLNGCPIDKDTYRQLEIASHVDLADASNTQASDFTRNILRCLDIDGLRQRKQANIERFIGHALATPSAHWQPLFHEWPAGSVPLNPIITCTNGETRDALRAFLMARNIFTAVHWMQPIDGVSSDEPSTLQLADRILTIPLDGRYGAEDVDLVFEIMMSFAPATDATQ